MTIFTATSVANDPSFQRRITYLMVKAAIAKLNAATPTNADILLGQSILDGGQSALLWAYAALGNPSIMAGAHNDTGETIADNDLEFAVNSLWSAFAV
jgi:hypothetical protein